MFANFRFSGVAALILLSCCALPPTNANTINYNNVCLLIENNELIASQSSCTEYYTCQNGVAVLSTCSSGFAFDKNSQQCLPASTVNCLAPGQSTCDSSNIGTWVSVPGQCQSFYYCSASGPLLGYCPNGENFSPASQSCVFASQYPCMNTNPDGSGDSVGSSEEDVGIDLCTIMPEGVFFGSASSCNGWNKCTNGIMTTGVCPAGFNFNPAMGNCDYIQNVNCDQVTYDPNLTNSPSVGSPCTTEGVQTPASQCNGYYICNGAQNVLYTCQAGYYYDTVSETCVPRMEARNDCDRCQGTTNSFVNRYSTNGCVDYLFCQNGVAVGNGTCGASSYFNEEAGACVVGAADPWFGCCNPNYYTTPTATGSTAAGTGTTAAGTGTTAAGTGTTAAGTGTTAAGTGTTAAGTGTTAAGTGTTDVTTTTTGITTTTA